jgi:hypothetical protein
VAFAVQGIVLIYGGKEKTQVDDEVLTLFEAAKALVTYIDAEQVFDKSADMGCGGYDTYQSETFFDLIANTKKAISEFEHKMKTS